MVNITHMMNFSTLSKYYVGWRHEIDVRRLDLNVIWLKGRR